MRCGCHGRARSRRMSASRASLVTVRHALQPNRQREGRLKRMPTRAKYAVRGAAGGVVHLEDNASVVIVFEHDSAPRARELLRLESASLA